MTAGEPLSQPEASHWSRCARSLQAELTEQEFNTWVRPLQAVPDGPVLRLLAPNRFVINWVEKHYLARIMELLNGAVEVRLEVGSRSAAGLSGNRAAPTLRSAKVKPIASRLDPNFTFETFVEGKSNQLAKAAATQIGQIPANRTTPYSYTVASA